MVMRRSPRQEARTHTSDSRRRRLRRKDDRSSTPWERSSKRQSWRQCVPERRTAVVTGGGRGVGAAVARGLSASGVAVLVAARTKSEVETLAATLRQSGATAHATTCDVTDPASIERLAVTAQDKFGQVDILINNAGAALSAAVHKTSLEEWNRMLAINATGAFLCLKAFLPGMLDRGWGRVVNVASTAGLMAD